LVEEGAHGGELGRQILRGAHRAEGTPGTKGVARFASLAFFAVIEAATVDRCMERPSFDEHL